jgi:hypothetical protein
VERGLAELIRGACSSSHEERQVEEFRISRSQFASTKCRPHLNSHFTHLNSQFTTYLNSHGHPRKTKHQRPLWVTSCKADQKVLCSSATIVWRSRKRRTNNDNPVGNIFWWRGRRGRS